MNNNKKIRIFHIASFFGNIGDYANHQGFYNKFNFCAQADFSQLEIRKFYKNRAEIKFDDKFIELVNSYDLLVLGGGGFFDLNWDYSRTGTTIDFSEKMIQNIKIPVLVNAMGYHEFGIPKQENIDKFKNFLKIVNKNKNWFISVRNDGTLNRMQQRYGHLTDNILHVPDNGFFFKPLECGQLRLADKDTTWIGLNITNDLFHKIFNRNVDAVIFNELIAGFVNKILAENDKYKIIFFPHTHKDIEIISLIMNKLEDRYNRERIVVAPFLIGEKIIDQVFDLYRICSCVVGMRFHSNVCCLGMNIPTLGLAGHEQISALYDELGLSSRCVKVDNEMFAEELFDKLIISLNNIKQIKEDYKKINFSLNEQADLYYQKLADFIRIKIL